MNSAVMTSTDADVLSSGDVLSIPLVAEALDVKIRTVETGRVNVRTRVVDKQQVVELPLERVEVDVERITLNQVVQSPLPVREEGDVTIISLYEEVAVVTKQLVLKEEIRIRRRKSVQMAPPQHVTLRHEEATVTRHPAKLST